MSTTLKGVKIWMPRGATLTARPGIEQALDLNGVGTLRDMLIVEEGKAFELTLEASTAAGEFLADCLKTGKATLVLQPGQKPVVGQKAHLRIVVLWADAAAHLEWLDKYGLASSLGGFS
jgi:hypothetical protein